MKAASSIALTLLIMASVMVWDPSVDPGDAIQQDVPAASSWLVLLYMAGDNNLGRDGYEWGNAVKMDVEEMESSMPDQGVEILALADMEGPSNTYLYDLSHDERPGINSTTIPLSEVNEAWGDELDMSDWKTLRDFLVYSLTDRQADRVMFVLWDHGAGWYSNSQVTFGTMAEAPSRGFALDTNSGGAMFLDEFREGFDGASSILGGLELDIIGFDTCSMGMMEVYYQVSPWFDLALGSEDEQPWYGYNYSFVSFMDGPDPPGPKELGQHIIQKFSEQYSDPGEYTYGTISLVDLKHLRDSLSPALDSLALPLIERMYQNEVIEPQGFRAVRNRVETLGFENLDLGDLLLEMKRSSLQADIIRNATRALVEYNFTVLDEWHKPDGRNPDATGISIYLPPPFSYRTDYDGSTGFLNFTGATRWDELIREFHYPMERVRVDLTVSVMDGDGLKDDLVIEVVNPQVSMSIPHARIFIDGGYAGEADESGVRTLKDMQPGTYIVEAYNGTHVGQADIRILNRPPTAIVSSREIFLFEGQFVIVDGTPSFDPDGDKITFRWDLDSTDGWGDVDSTSPWVNLSYQESGDHRIMLTVSDGEYNSSVEVLIHVENLPPTARISAPPYVFEDQFFNVSASGSWDTIPDVWDLYYRFLVNGEVERNWSVIDRAELRLSESGNHTISVEVRDPDGTIGTAQTIVEVKNVPPTAVIQGPTRVNEDQPLAFSSLASTDTISDLNTLVHRWYTGDTMGPPHEGYTFKTSFPDEGRYDIILVVTDDDEVSGTAVLQVEVNNLAPMAFFGDPISPVEDQIVVLDGGLSTDTPSDLDDLSFFWDLDGDLVHDMEGRRINASWPVSGSYLITLKVTDDNGASDTISKMMNVRNLPPTVMLSGPLHAQEDERVVITIDGNMDTPSDLEALQIMWYVDGSLVPGEGTTLTRSFSKEGPHTIEAVVIDDQGATGNDTLYLTIVNPPPTVHVDNIPAEITEGERFTAMGYRSTDTASDILDLTFQWLLDGKLIPEENGKNITIKAKGEGQHDLTLRVTDDEGASSEVTVRFNVVSRGILGVMLDGIFSTIGLVLLLILIIFILFGIYRFRKEVLALPEPESKEERPEQNVEREPPKEGSTITEAAPGHLEE
ncbi:MAG: hypothetical protein JW939_09285, partial [Candidatus Thermoplasmatota archaeon]|nr:hypothetical protein [Candidatus Thermoplasmatota archaeon]